MSTFDGYVKEFPDIRIDFFRSQPGRKPPHKCFLSHVHSDHLRGLESLKSPFVYCSPATREILLRLEKYPHRINLAKGILESRKQHYKHLKDILKPVPLNTPSDIELGPGNFIRVTLLDANHCAGAVMFLIQGGGKAILYTGDIRSEPWWVDNLVRNPVLIPFTHGQRRLDNIYLDTTFAAARHEIPSFPTKAEGLAELLKKVALYPQDTVFHIHAWTFGYEEVWVALANMLDSQIHVDDYTKRLYQSLRVAVDDASMSSTGRPADRTRDLYLAAEAAALCGHRCGNNEHPGCLTSNQNVRLHSCEVGTDCKALRSENVVWITPILTRSADGNDVLEVGAGGGVGDLTQHELELDDRGMAEELLRLCFRAVKDLAQREEIRTKILNVFLCPDQKIPLGKLSSAFSDRELPLGDLAQIMINAVKGGRWNEGGLQETGARQKPIIKKTLPRQILFPYSRHSSYDELCHLVSVFKPKDIYPCTVDAEHWTKDVSIQCQFGHLCSEDVFAHDAQMEAYQDKCQMRHRLERARPADSSQNELRSSSQASQTSEAEQIEQALGDASACRSPAEAEHVREISTTPRAKRRRTDEEPNTTAKRKSPNTLMTASTSTFSDGIRHDRLQRSFQGQLTYLSEKARSREHSASDPNTPVLQETEPKPSSSKHHTSPKRQGFDRRTQRTRISASCKAAKEGTQAQPIDISDQDSDSEATTDGELPSNMDGVDEAQDTQITLSDSAFESHSQLQQECAAARVKNRKDAYRAAKDLVTSGWETDFVIVSSKSGNDDEEIEL